MSADPVDPVALPAPVVPLPVVLEVPLVSELLVLLVPDGLMVALPEPVAAPVPAAGVLVSVRWHATSAEARTTARMER